MSKAIRVYSVIRRGKEQWLVAHRKEILSGPWKSQNEASEARLEWVVK